MNRFTFVDCTSVPEALNELDQDAVAKAGGIDLLDLMKDGIVSPPKLVNIRNISSLRGIDSSEKGLSLGPLTTLHELSAHPEIRKQYTALCGCSRARGHAADSKHGYTRRQSDATFPLLVFSVRRISLSP